MSDYSELDLYGDLGSSAVAPVASAPPVMTPGTSTSNAATTVASTAGFTAGTAAVPGPKPATATATATAAVAVAPPLAPTPHAHPALAPTPQAGSAAHGAPSMMQGVEGESAGHFPESRASVFVGNLRWFTTDADIRGLLPAAFAASVLDVRFYEDKQSGRSRGLALVIVPDRLAATELMSALRGRSMSAENGSRPLLVVPGPEGPDLDLGRPFDCHAAMPLKRAIDAGTMGSLASGSQPGNSSSSFSSSSSHSNRTLGDSSRFGKRDRDDMSANPSTDDFRRPYRPRY
eukprot:ANDGO_06261.mRNA.1 hypothetical protein